MPSTEMNSLDIQQPARQPKGASMASPAANVQDLICIGFGPASLAIGAALTDAELISSKITFLERQPRFAWHSGMQLPGAKMQISFLKDMATPRNPYSKFTFISYLFSQGRLNNFINLSTFTPSRAEYEDYLRWVARYFEHRGLVRYSEEVVAVEPSAQVNGKTTQFKVSSRNVATGEVTTRFTRRVVVAVGGKAIIPKEFPADHSQVIHSSQFSTRVAKALPDTQKPYNLAVVGNGQSAAEIFNDLSSRFPNAKVTLLIKGSALRPSDDSPFVNEIFDPDRVDGIFTADADLREKSIKLDKATNYGVVRLELLEHLYEKLYIQRMKNPDPKTWKINIKNQRQVVAVKPLSEGKLLLQTSVVQDGKVLPGKLDEELVVDAVFVATGYTRNAHEGILKETRSLLPSDKQAGSKFVVGRDYKIAFDQSKIDENAGIWLQGCNEKTHGLSDSLLSILAVRGGELVNSMFGEDVVSANGRVRAML